MPATEKRAFDSDGFLVKENLFSADEVGAIRAMVAARVSTAQPRVLPDVSGHDVSVRIETGCPPDDILEIIARQRRVVDLAQNLLEGEVYHYFTKLPQKGLQGGSFEWHQDYRFWYKQGCLRPAMCAVSILLDPMLSDNGPLRLIRGSHLLGRLDHLELPGEQARVADGRLSAILERYPVAEVVAPAGTAVFFHANTIHGSPANSSGKPRRTIIPCYNLLGNSPYLKGYGNPSAPIDVLDTIIG